MNIGIFTYGTRGDVQPYIALALGLIAKGHKVIIAAPENFKGLVEEFDITFHPLTGNVEETMNGPEGQYLLKSENTIELIRHFYKLLSLAKVPLRKSYIEGFNKVDFIIANAATLPITSAIAEKQNKKLAITYFMPPVIPTGEFPLADFDFLNFPLYNKLTYKLVHFLFWKFLKSDVNEFRQELGLPVLKENLLKHIDKQGPLDLYCLSPNLIAPPNDWDNNHKITGFLTVPESGKNGHYHDDPPGLNDWLQQGSKPIYMGFGSNGIGKTDKFINAINKILNKTSHRILFCTGWAQFDDLPVHKNLFVTKYVNHARVLPKCAAGIFHGGAGTLAAMLRNDLPVIIISFYTDQPTWGKIVERKGLGVHIPVKKLTAEKLILAIARVSENNFRARVAAIGEQIRNEQGLENAISEIEMYFGNTLR